MKPISLIVFDCDGVLIDSELLSGTVLIEEAARIGIMIDMRFFFDQLIGCSYQEAVKRIAIQTGHTLPDGFEALYRTALLARFETSLQPITGIETVLKRLKVPYCVATSSGPERARRSLEIVGLAPYFTGRIFTASQVQRGKPAPDLFLYAAAQMNVAPDHCLVLEDSSLGLTGAKAAGMTAWHFSGGSHFQAGYQMPGGGNIDRSVTSMADFLAMMVQFGLA